MNDHDIEADRRDDALDDEALDSSGARLCLCCYMSQSGPAAGR